MQISGNLQFSDKPSAFWKANEGGTPEPSKNPGMSWIEKHGLFHGEENQAVDLNNGHYSTLSYRGGYK